ncbi:C69 family dipeptidase [Mobiluncus porci]|uniref:Dipeptidase n=1 Tax=Mobiluncus porci TaxID=2652278 RepID=A0A7K0K3N0_9ACTO|nr:C69 family dipeptidase [Mobiluncus porci]MST50093.1 C69 family dipeptidase [Mobiluncus porci]
MGCTTIIVGKNASANGATIMARTDDSGHGSFSAKKFEVIPPNDSPSTYRSVLSHVEVPLPAGGLRYTRFPDVDGKKGLWAGAGINSALVSMTATETLTTNERVLAADPLVELQEAVSKPGDPDYKPEIPGGIGEEDMVVLVLPYIHCAREGVTRLGELLETYGTYEMNGIGFADRDEVWWLETVGGHHWLARRLPDDCYAVIANQFSLDYFDFEDAFGEAREYMCSADLREFVAENHLDLGLYELSRERDPEPIPVELEGNPVLGFSVSNSFNPSQTPESAVINPRLAFGSRTDSDHTYNTPRVWALQRFFNPGADWDGPEAYLRPDSDDLPWCREPERKITMEDVKYAESYHYQGLPFDPYARPEQAMTGGADKRGIYRPIGINRTNFDAFLELRPGVPEAACGLNWIAFGAMPFNTAVPFYANVRAVPEYLGGTTPRVTTESHYWENRIIAALVDAHFHQAIAHVERYQQATVAKALAVVAKTDRAVWELLTAGSAGSANSPDSGDSTKASATSEAENVVALVENPKVQALLEAANEEIAAMLKRETDDLLDKVLFEASLNMHCAFSRDDA